MARKASDDLTDAEVERRATEALRRALMTPYKPQRDMVGKGKHQPSSKRKKAASGEKER